MDCAPHVQSHSLLLRYLGERPYVRNWQQEQQKVGVAAAAWLLAAKKCSSEEVLRAQENRSNGFFYWRMQAGKEHFEALVHMAIMMVAWMQKKSA